MPLHRLIAPSYLGGLPGTHDYINDPVANGDAGVAVLADAKKSTGPNAGTYYVAFGEDGTSSNANRGMKALSQNTDYLDDVVNGEAPMVDNVDGTAPGGGLASVVVTGSIFVGKSGTANSQLERDRLFKVLDSSTGNDLISATGLKVQVTLVHDGASNNQVGVPASGFYTDPTLVFTPAIPAAATYRLVFGRRSSLVNAIKSKTTLDGFTREVIQGSHQASAEIVRWIREAGRRSGGALQALALTTLETPGLGENLLAKAKVLTVDLDPDDTQGTSATFRVRRARDVAVETLFQVVSDNGAAIPYYWGVPTGSINLRDANVQIAAATTGLEVLPLTNNAALGHGDGTMRVPGAEDAYAPGTYRASILRSLNARITMTVGDGTSSWGDFSGPDAIYDALEFIKNNTTATLIAIQVKPGSYTFTNATRLVIPAGYSVILEGVDQGRAGVTNGVMIANDCSSGFAIAATGTVGSPAKVELRGIRVINGASSLPNLLQATRAAVVVENCSFRQQQISMVDAPTQAWGTQAFRVSNSQITSGGVPPVTFSFGAVLGDAYSEQPLYLFENSLLAAGDLNVPLVDVVQTANLASNVFVNGIIFNRCTLKPGSTTATAAAFTNAANNCGVLRLSPGGFNDVVIGEIAYNDCNVNANESALGTSSVLLYLRSNDGSGQMYVDRLNIHGGLWTLPQADTLVTPFYIGGATQTGTSYVNNVSLKNVSMGFDPRGTLAGFSAHDLGDTPTEVLVARVKTAAFFISCTEVLELEDFNLLGLSAGNGGVIDLSLFQPKVFNCRGVYLKNFLSTGTTPPLYRVRIEGRTVSGGIDEGSKGSIENLVVDASGGGANAVHDSLGALIGVLPNGRMVLEDPVVVGSSHVTGRGIMLLNGELTAGWYDGYGLKVYGGRFHSHGQAGIYHAGSTTAAVLGASNLDFVECDFTGIGRGIHFPYVNIPNPGNTLRVCKCIFDATGDVGLDVQGKFDQVIANDNAFHACNGGGATVQMRVGSSSWQPEGCAIGNSSALGSAKIKVYDPTKVRGSETDWAGNVINGNAMIVNHATLETP